MILRTKMVSIIMPCYNAGKYIREAMESVQSQLYTDWELLIVDDGSTDNSRDVANEYVAKDMRIHLIDQPNSGACRARNNGIEHAKGEYIKFLDADDVLFPDALAQQVKQISTLGERQIPFGDYDNVDENGQFISEYVFTQQDELDADPVAFFFNEWRVLISCPLHRTRLLREIGGFNETLMRGQEADLHLRLALADVEWVHFKGKQFKYREYIAPYRISCSSRQKSQMMLRFREQRMMICEQLFKEKYEGVIPSRYRTYFRDVWFDKARREFAEKKKQEGKESLRHAKMYGPMSRFQNVYIMVGGIIGLTGMERLLRIRLKLIGKEIV